MRFNNDRGCLLRRCLHIQASGECTVLDCVRSNSSYGGTDRHANQYTYGYGNEYTNGHRNRHAHRYIYKYGNPRADRYSNEYTNGHGNSRTNRHTHQYTDGHDDQHTYGYTDRNGNRCPDS